MESIVRISSPLSEPWFAWLLLVLLLMLMWAVQRQPGLLARAWNGTFARTERMYSDAAVDWIAAVLSMLFRFGMSAVALDILFFHGGEFSISQWALTMALMVCVEIVKVLVAWVFHFTFRLPSQFGIMYMQYTNIWLLTSIGLVLPVLLAMSLGLGVGMYILFAVVALFFGVALVYKAVQMYMSQLWTIGVILLYIITMEMLPLAIDAWITAYWIM